MKSRLMCVAVLLCFGHSLFAQSAWNDAIKLKKLIVDSPNQANFDTAASILKNYLPDSIKNKPGLSGNIVKALYQTNPFIPAGFKTATLSNSTVSLSNISSVISSIGGLDVTNIADGFAKFIVKRTKEELNISFFTRFKEVLEDSNYRDIKTVFPGTYDLLEDVGAEIYNYNRYIQNLREAFNSDMKALPKNIPSIIDNHPEIFSEYPEVATALRSAFYVTNSLMNQVHPGDVLADYPLEYLDNLKNKNFKGATQTLQLISASLHDTATSDTANYWITNKQLRKLSNDKITFQIYLGLIYQQVVNKDIQFEKISLKAVLDKVAETYNTGDSIYQAYKGFVVTFSEKASALEKTMKSYNRSDKDSVKVELYAKCFRGAVELIEYGTEAGKLPFLKETKVADLHQTMEPYFDISYSAADLVTSIDRKNYPAAVNKAVHIYEVVKNMPTRDLNKLSYRLAYARINATDAQNKPEAISDITKSININAILTAGDRLELSAFRNIKLTDAEIDALAKLIGNRTVVQKYVDKLNLVLNKLSMYGSFISTVAIAKSSDDVESAIEAFALPSGSARIKRESQFNVSLNAYCGLFTGYELIEGYDEFSEFQFNTHGITAPIGIAISKGKAKFLGMPKRKNEKHWSYSAFVSVFDLGAVTAFRFNDPAVSQIPKIQLKDILSPGLLFSIGLPKCPLSINTGAQIGPNLRSVSQSNNIYADKLYWRFSLSLVVDIPILNLYTKSAN